MWKRRWMGLFRSVGCVCANKRSKERCLRRVGSAIASLQRSVRRRQDRRFAVGWPRCTSVRRCVFALVVRSSFGDPFCGEYGLEGTLRWDRLPTNRSGCAFCLGQRDLFSKRSQSESSTSTTYGQIRTSKPTTGQHFPLDSACQCGKVKISSRTGASFVHTGRFPLPSVRVVRSFFGKEKIVCGSLSYSSA